MEIRVSVETGPATTFVTVRAGSVVVRTVGTPWIVVVRLETWAGRVDTSVTNSVVRTPDAVIVGPARRLVTVLAGSVVVKIVGVPEILVVSVTVCAGKV